MISESDDWGRGLPERRERYLGMLWGMVLGDCLGTPLSRMDKDAHPFVTDMQETHRAGATLPAGSWTGISAQAICIIDSFVRLRRVDTADMAQTLARWSREGYASVLCFGVGAEPASRLALERIDAERARSGAAPARDHGSLNRLAPSYILAHATGDPVILHEISNITHDCEFVREKVTRMGQILDAHMLGLRTDYKSAFDSRANVRNEGDAGDLLNAALWAFRKERTFAEGMLAAVNLGGHAACIGSIYGQIAGAYYGVRSIPVCWLEAVRKRARLEALFDEFLSALPAV